MKEKIYQITNQIKECENQYSDLLIKSETIKANCIKEMNSFLKTKYKEQIEYSVKTKTEITNNLGLEKLKELKIKMNKLIENVDIQKSIIEDNDEIWKVSNSYLNSINFAGDIFGIQYNAKQSIENDIKNLIRHEYSNIGKLLLEYGYVEIKNQSGMWEKKNNEIVYKYGIVLSETLMQIIKEYQENFEKAFDIKQNIYKLNKELEETKALDLWEQA